MRPLLQQPKMRDLFDTKRGANGEKTRAWDPREKLYFSVVEISLTMNGQDTRDLE